RTCVASREASDTRPFRTGSVTGISGTVHAAVGHAVQRLLAIGAPEPRPYALANKGHDPRRYRTGSVTRAACASIPPARSGRHARRRGGSDALRQHQFPPLVPAVVLFRGQGVVTCAVRLDETLATPRRALTTKLRNQFHGRCR